MFVEPWSRWRNMKTTCGLWALATLLLLPPLDAEGCYEDLRKDLASTIAGRDARSNSTEEFLGSCQQLRTALRRDAEAWLVVDGASRVLQVAFRGDAVRLLLLDHVTSAAECALHSRRDFAGPRGRLVKSFEHTRPASCDLEDDVHVATFRHVATGCYRLFHRADGRFSPEGCWVETDAAPARPRPSVALLGSSGSHFRVVHDFAAAFRGSTVAFYARRTLCEFAHNRGDLSWFVDLTGKTDSDAIICKNDANNQVTCGMTDELEVVCNITQLTEGNYCLYAVIINDDRCLLDHGNSCIFYTPLAVLKNRAEILTTPRSVTVPMKGGPAVVITVLVVTVIGTVMCLVVHFIWPEAVCLRNPWKLLADSSSPSKISEISSSVDDGTVQACKTEILLLYARDCQALMEVMEHFRSLLEKIPNTEVYDIFDRSRWDEIAQNPPTWLCELMARPGLKVIIVETLCAVLHQQSLYRRDVLHYCDPTSFSELFAQGLTLSLNNVKEIDTYKSQYVVRFEECDNETEQLTHVTPFRRFILPETIEALLNDIYFNCDLKVTDELKTLRQKIDDFVQYKKNNPQYLQTHLLRAT